MIARKSMLEGEQAATLATSTTGAAEAKKALLAALGTSELRGQQVASDPSSGDTTARPARPFLNEHAKRFIGLSEAVSDRFTKGVVEEAAEAPREGLQVKPTSEARATTKPEPPPRIAKPTRLTTLWRPEPLLCKRLNVPLPTISREEPPGPGSGAAQTTIGALSRAVPAGAGQGLQAAGAPLLSGTGKSTQGEPAASEEADTGPEPSDPKPPRSFFKSIFENSESEEGEDEDEDLPQEQLDAPASAPVQPAREPAPRAAPLPLPEEAPPVACGLDERGSSEGGSTDEEDRKERKRQKKERKREKKKDSKAKKKRHKR